MTEDDAIANIATQLAKDIDREVLMTVMDWKPFEFSEGRVFGARYHTVEPKFSYPPGWYNQGWNDMMAWCVETFGPTAHDGVWTPSMRWYANNSKFWFRHQKDLDWFILKWGA